MNALPAAFALPLALLFAAGVHAQAPAGAPAGSTGLCKDGSYTDAAARKGACRGHQGIKEWYAADAASAAKAGGSAPPAMRGTTAPASGSPPAGSSGLCKDGTYTDAAAKKGACRGHQGVKEWYGASAAKPAAPAPAAAPPAAPPIAPPAASAPTTPTPTPARPATPVPSAPATRTPEPPTAAAAPGGGAGKVWVNLESKVYHCPADRYYGRTKHGQYMSEAQAQAAGNHAAHGKTCSP